jgi:tetratricopeptide (TPR) repeat protein
MRIGSYDVLSALGEGGAAELFVAAPVDAPGQRVALKILRGVANEEETARLRREFRALRRLDHPNVLGVRDWGVTDGRPWYAMELVDGEDLRKVGPRWQSLEPEDRFTRVHALLVSVARALAYIHEHGIVHRDVSPGNILVGGDGAVKLMDFGLATDRASQLTGVGEVMGTLAFTAPEQITGARVDGRADLYGLGAVLYVLLTGRRPFQAHTAQALLEQQMHAVPRPPRELDPLVPEPLEQVCLRLLAKEPGSRFASAAHLLAVLGDAEEPRERGVWPPQFVGRTDVRAWLSEALEDADQRRRGAALVLTGPSGVGKTRLLDVADQTARRRGLRVVRGRCRRHDRPFGAFFSVYEGLGGRDGTDPMLDAAFDPERGDGRIERYAVIAAFRERLLRYAPCVVVIDEVEKADAATRELLNYLVRNTVEHGDDAVVFALGGEVDIEGPQALLQGLHNVRRVRLMPFQSGEVEEILLALVPSSAAALALAARLHEETEGSPAYLADMLRALVDEGVLAKQGDRYALTLAAEAVSRSSLPLPQSLRAALGERIEPLSPMARDVARVVALSRRGLDFEVLLEVVGAPEPDILDALAELVDDGIVREDQRGSAPRVELAEARLREVLLADTPADELADRHRQLGERLEVRHRRSLAAVVEDLAWHFEQAGRPGKACAYLARTAARQMGQANYEEALFFLDRARAMEPLARPVLLLEEADQRRATIDLDRSRALFHLGRWDEAREAATAALATSEALGDPARVAEAAAELGRIHRNRARLAEAETALERALQAAEQTPDRRLRLLPLYELAALRWGLGAVDEAEAMWTASMNLARELGDEAAEASAYRGLGIIAFGQGRSAEARAHQEASAERFERLGMLDPLAVTWVNLIELYKLMGRLPRAVKLADRMIAQSRELRHGHGMAMGLAWRSRLLAVLGRHDDARRTAQEALHLSVGLDTKEEQILVLATLIELQFATGNDRFAMPRITGLLEILDAVDPEGLRPLVLGMAARCHHARGERTAALGRAEEAAATQSDLLQTRVRTGLVLGRAWRELGERGRAADALRPTLREATMARWDLPAMVAHRELARVLDGVPAAEHRQRAVGLARTMSAELGREDALRFVTDGWARDLAR